MFKYLEYYLILCAQNYHQSRFKSQEICTTFIGETKYFNNYRRTEKTKLTECVFQRPVSAIHQWFRQRRNSLLSWLLTAAADPGVSDLWRAARLCEMTWNQTFLFKTYLRHFQFEKNWKKDLANVINILNFFSPKNVGRIIPFKNSISSYSDPQIWWITTPHLAHDLICSNCLSTVYLASLAPMGALHWIARRSRKTPSWTPDLWWQTIHRSKTSCDLCSFIMVGKYL